MMAQSIHQQARTTHLVRAEIQASNLTQAELARKYNVSRQTIRKWKEREAVADGSHRPNKLDTTLTPAQELIVIELRKTLLLATDDLLVVTREFINPAASRAGIGRLLRRYGVSDLKKLLPGSDSPLAAPKTFKEYEPGFLHIDIKYLPRMPDEEEGHHYLFVAIDRATRWVFIHVYPDQTELSATDFLRKAEDACPFKIKTILTDNGTQFTDRFTSKKKVPSGNHSFDKACTQAVIDHRLIPPRHPQTNGMVERFNGRIAEIVGQTRFPSLAALRETLHNYVRVYNHNIPQRALKHQTPIQAMKVWQKSHPELFIKRVYDHAGLDN